MICKIFVWSEITIGIPWYFGKVVKKIRIDAITKHFVFQQTQIVMYIEHYNVII